MEYRGKSFVFLSSMQLGQGGMAEVYLGTRQDDPSTHVALKVPRPDLDQEIRDLFLREAEAASRVSCPQVVQIVDWGDEPAFIAFEFIEGGTLADELRTRQGDKAFWTECELIGLYRQLVTAMSAINQQVIHRDLKPENIFYHNHILKVADFGISKYVGELTRTHTFKGWGTAPYMSPEAFTGESTDWRADQYSLGIIFSEMATLQRPFLGNSEDMERCHLFVRPPRVTDDRPELSNRLASMIACMLEKRPEQRFASWDAILSELVSLEERAPVPTPPALDDLLVRKAAEHVESVKSRELERQRLMDERRRNEKLREDLLDYWADELFGKVQEKVDHLNRELGPGTVAIKRNRSRKGDVPTACDCVVSFINAKLDIHLEACPAESQGFLVWGGLVMETHKRIWAGNLLLLDEPQPYGSWYEVDMKVAAGMNYDYRPGQEGGRGYDLFGQERIVLARNWKCLLAQRDLRNTISGVDYREKPLAFDILLKEVMAIFIEDAAVEPPRKR